MKKLIFSLFFLAFTAQSTAQNTATLSGKISHPTGEKAYLRTLVMENGRYNHVYLDSCILEDGLFQLQADLDSLTFLIFYDGKEHTGFYLAPGENLELYLDTKLFDESIIYKGDHSDLNNMLHALSMSKEIFNYKLNWVISNTETKILEDLDTTILFAEIDHQDQIIIDYINANKDAYPELKNALEDEIDIRNKRNKKFKEAYRKRYRMRDLENSLVGQPFIEISGVNLKDKNVQLSDFYGQLMVIDFWANWCGPCKAEFPGLHELEKSFENKVTFVSIGIYCKKEAWKEMAEIEGFKNNIFLDKEEAEKLKEAYMLSSIPRYIILNGKGEIININAPRPSLGLEDLLNDLLN